MKEQEFFEKMAAVWLELSTVQEAATSLEQQMAQLESAGMTSATIHTRSDNGGMELLHSSGSEYEQQHGRRREYVGKNPDKQLEARCKVKRFQSYQSLKSEWQKVASRRIEIYRQIERLEIVALGKQNKLFSDVGTKPSSVAGNAVPTDWNWLSPKMVIEYFKRSPNLAAIADDVEQILGKVEWAESERLAA